MDRPRCPGQDQRFWKPEDIFCVNCPDCGAEIEFWKDEPFHYCRKCTREVRNPRLNFGCAKWCKFAKECLGGLPDNPDLVVPIRDRLIAAMKEVFGTDQRRIDHALKVLEYVEAIAKEEGGSAIIVKAAAILHDIGIQEAERKHGSAAGNFQELEGPPIARRIMEKMRLEEDIVAAVCTIIAHHHNGACDTPEFAIIWDADWLVNLGDEFPLADAAERERQISRLFRTGAGRRLATALYLQDKP